MYVVLPADPSKEPWVLSEVLTSGIVVDALRQAVAKESSGTK